MKKVFQSEYLGLSESICEFINEFDNTGNSIKDSRNKLKLFQLDGKTINIKSFKIPNLINQIVYRFFRKSKAQRSFEYANRLMELGIGTPMPIAYFESFTPFLFKKSFYVSEQLESDLTYRELTKQFDYPDYDTILRSFTRFTYELHQKGVNFLDHSPGNTLIKKEGNEYKFFLVDLNRMKFGPMNFETRIKNFARLTIHKSMVEVMSDEYSKCSGEDYNEVCKLMWQYTNEFQNRHLRKQRLKKMLKFWK
ncbi:lipopolysaccharide kinase InaA family protein [Mangrovimonas sp. YM274]|uniref:lipopolysaccharide kinase InaA family protein n=1 Tax=Mangrovimonas sp. YM274 TaxID=3070660 RepID=UPI0027DCDBDA|nr:lipopolysaccharide kinase InaA family protein [Mangrovimonas sp. YM274]WMI67841.1 lipopolysaccharide kinase InaA family protein [Mangrovimonas sp. YM274]